MSAGGVARRAVRPGLDGRRTLCPNRDHPEGRFADRAYRWEGMDLDLGEGGPVIEILTEQVKSKQHFTKLLAFCREVMVVCKAVGIAPVLSGSLAVLGYTQGRTMEIHDIDLACSELDFPRLCRALEAQGIRCELRPWHVMQALQDDLKVEFDSMEYWLADVPEEYETLVVDRIRFKTVGLAGLRELYRRGLEETCGEGEGAKHLAIAEKYEALCGV